MVENVSFRPARPEDAHALSELALRSKGHWGYDTAFLEACRAELTVTEDECARGKVVVALGGEELLGFYALEGRPPTGVLAGLFVDPPFIGRGIGAQLLRHALAEALARGHQSLTLDADPGAESFYVRFGAAHVGQSPSGSIPGRMLPRLRFTLSSTGPAAPGGR